MADSLPERVRREIENVSDRVMDASLLRADLVYLARIAAEEAAQIAATVCRDRARILRHRKARPQHEDRSDEASYLQGETRAAIRRAFGLKEPK